MFRRFRLMTARWQFNPRWQSFLLNVLLGVYDWAKNHNKILMAHIHFHYGNDDRLNQLVKKSYEAKEESILTPDQSGFLTPEEIVDFYPGIEMQKAMLLTPFNKLFSKNWSPATMWLIYLHPDTDGFASLEFDTFRLIKLDDLGSNSSKEKTTRLNLVDKTKI